MQGQGLKVRRACASHQLRHSGRPQGPARAAQSSRAHVHQACPVGPELLIHFTQPTALHGTDGAAEAQRSRVTCLRPPRIEWGQMDVIPDGQVPA